MACSKYSLTNTGSTLVNFNYRRCDDSLWEYQVELEPNQTKNIWLINNTYSIATSFKNLVLLVNQGVFPLVSPSQTQTPTQTPTPTNTPTPSITPTNTPTQTNTSTNTPTPTPTNTETPTNTPTPTNTETPTNTPTPTNTETPTNTPTPTNTETPTNTPTSTNTPTPTNTETPTNTPTNTETPTPTVTPGINTTFINNTTTGNATIQSLSDDLGVITLLNQIGTLPVTTGQTFYAYHNTTSNQPTVNIDGTGQVILTITINGNQLSSVTTSIPVSSVVTLGGAPLLSSDVLVVTISDN